MVCRSSRDDDERCASPKLMKKSDAGRLNDARFVGCGLGNVGSGDSDLVDVNNGDAWMVHVDVANRGDDAGAVHLE